jgi:Holliday junction resolvase RusA-like endonuclease
MRYIIPIKLENWNDIIDNCRGNKYRANSHKKQEMRDISYFIRKIPKIEKYPVRMDFRWHIKNVRSDLDNKSVKSILDCMQKLGILENDNIKHISEIRYIAIPDKEDYVEIEVEEYVIK